MGRHPDLERRAELLDAVVGYLGQHGVAGVSLRPVARELGVSVNALTHHFGSKDELVVAALRRAAEIQREVEERWRQQEPHLSTTELQRRWWRWINHSPEHLALVRLGLEAATLDATVSGLPGDVRAEQISFWREGIADDLIADGINPQDAEREASLAKATFTGLVLDLLATGHRERLTDALECTLSRLDGLARPAPSG
jgi:AcrR family transcriptional regulator